VGKGQRTESCLDQSEETAQDLLNGACQHSRGSEGALGEVEKAARDGLSRVEYELFPLWSGRGSRPARRSWPCPVDVPQGPSARLWDFALRESHPAVNFATRTFAPRVCHSIQTNIRSLQSETIAHSKNEKLPKNHKGNRLPIPAPSKFVKPPWELLQSWALSETQARTLLGFVFTTVGVLRTGFLEGFASVFFDSI
jgi:hypothetical protein